MKKLHLFKTVLLLCALIVGSVSAWATPETYTFSSLPTTGWKTSGGSQTINSKSWTYSRSTYIGCDDKIQIGSKKNPQTSAWTISIPVSSFGSGKAITNVTITAYTTATSATYDVSVGGTSYSSGSLTTSSSNYSTGNINVTTGNIVVTMTGSSTSKAMYLSNISVTYDDASTDPVINASNVNIDAEDTEGAISFSITNPVAETHLSATITAGGTWLSNATVDEVNGKVTFVTSVNDDTENSREGTIHLVYGDNLATKDITVTQAAMPLKYTVTYTTAQENGTLVIKNGDDVVTSGSSFAEGTVLTIVTTPDPNYVFRNWQYKREGGSWTTLTAATTYTMTANNVEFQANFDPTYPANFSVNGEIASTSRFKAGASVDFPKDVESFDGFVFIGWAEAPVSGVVAVKPTLVDTSAEKMGSAEKTYYAVFAKTTSVSATFDPTDLEKTPLTGSLTWTDTDTGIELYLTAGSHYTENTPYTFTTTAGTDNYMEIRRDDALLKRIVVTTTSTTYKPNKWVAYEKVEDTSGTTVTTSVSASGSVYTLNLTNPYESVCCFAQSNKQIRATSIVVEAEKIEEAYCTSLVETATVTAAGYATYVTKNNVEFAAGDAYTVSISGDKAVLNEVTRVPAGTAVVLKGEGTKTAIVLTDTPDAVVNDLQVSDGSVAGDGSTIYVLAQKASVVGFYLLKSDVTIPDGKAYLVVAGGGAREFIGFEDGETTGISEVRGLKADVRGEYFNLNGQRVAQPSKGLYIVNGKKVMFK